MTAQMIERITKDYYSHFCGIDFSSSKCGTYFICSAERDEKLRGFGCKYAIHILVNGSLCVVSYSPKHRALIEQLKKCGGDEIILAASRHFCQIHWLQGIWHSIHPGRVGAAKFPVRLAIT